MGNADRELAELRRKIGQLADSQAQLLERLGRLEARLEPPKPVSEPKPEPPPALVPVTVPRPEVPASVGVDLGAASPAPIHTGPVAETRLGLNFLNRIAAVTLVLAAGYFFKYAVDNDWIGEAGRVMLGLGAGFVVALCGRWLAQRGQTVFAAGATALGGGVMYLSSYAAWGFYHLVPTWAAFILLAAVTLFTVALSALQRSEILCGLAVAAGYTAPILLNTGESRPWFLFSYYLLLSAGSIWLARRMDWSKLAWMSWGVPAVAFLLWAARASDGRPGPAYLLGLLFQLLFLFGFSKWMAQGTLVWGPLVLGLASISGHWGFVPAAWASGLLGLTAERRRRLSHGVNLCLAGALLGYLAWLQTAHLPRQAGLLWLFLCGELVILTGWVSSDIGIRRVPVTRSHLSALGAIATVYFSASYLLLTDYRDWMGLFAVAFGALECGLAWWLFKVRKVEDTRPVLLLLGAGLCAFSLAVPIQLSGYSITIGWAIEAAALVWIAGRLADKRPLLAAAAIYALVSLRLSVTDAWAGDALARRPLMNVRFLTFLVAALAFGAGAYGLRRWRELRTAAMALYVAAHITTLAILVLELADGASRMGDPARAAKTLSVAVSGLFALYGAVLVAIGVWRRSVLDRLIGLACLALVVLKVYVHDLWVLDRLFRVSVLALTGGLLLSASWVYSRYRGQIESFWRSDANLDL